jgi:hypothetical protein
MPTHDDLSAVAGYRCAEKTLSDAFDDESGIGLRPFSRYGLSIQNHFKTKNTIPLLRLSYTLKLRVIR